MHKKGTGHSVLEPGCLNTVCLGPGCLEPSCLEPSWLRYLTSLAVATLAQYLLFARDYSCITRVQEY